MTARPNSGHSAQTVTSGLAKTGTGWEADWQFLAGIKRKMPLQNSFMRLTAYKPKAGSFGRWSTRQRPQNGPLQVSGEVRRSFVS